MIDLINGFFSKALSALAKYGPDPVLAFVLFVAFLWALTYGHADPVAALLGLVIIWAGYLMRSVASERHKEHMAALEVEKLQKTRGAPILADQKKRLSKRSNTRKAIGKGHIE
jgi:hypothetical protein